MKAIVFLLGTTTLAFASASIYLWQQGRSDREQRDALQARVHELERGAQVPATGRVQPRVAVPPSPDLADPPLQAAAASVAQPVRTMIESQRRILQNPEYRAALHAQQRMFLEEMYSDVGALLRLPPEDVDRLLDLLAEHQLRAANDMPDLPMPGEAGYEKSVAEWQRTLEEEGLRQRAEIAALLGDARFREWEDYQRNTSARMQVRELRRTLEGSSDALREDQLPSLVSAIAEEEGRYAAELQNEDQTQPATGAERIAMQEQALEGFERYRQRMQDALAAHLSPKQLARFNQKLNQQLQMQRLNLAMLREQVEAEARGEVPAMDDPAQIAFEASQGVVITQP